MLNKFYVYGHFRYKNTAPFYIGKGSDKRAWSKKNRNKYWKRIISKNSYEVRILCCCLEENMAFDLEKKLIGEFRSKGGCEANFTIGGEGGNTFINKSTEQILDFKNKMRKITLQRPVKCLRVLKGPDHPQYGKPGKPPVVTVRSRELCRLSKLGSLNPMSSRHGHKHPRFSGWWITPAGRFDRLEDAEKANNTKSVKYRCLKSKSNKFAYWTFERKK